MKESTKNAVQGKLHQVRGNIKETVGTIVKNVDLEAEGKAEIINGTIQEHLGKIEKELGR
ncbi:CsbD family protein [Megalodesulfovibrio gigas]|uniref:CsbD-like domain-containing protein n=1 Tax=Megalodesulfovibrio gigas (strain ATCC 19364 / DSM 1382 / NCIMB 9332 / VKM B-1759) TaxID=1121448 RepID=T2GFT0_MEGG1|nr:CsbD family protein [Megalodesulfovibrio gigas]AGW15049.1 hypothetical protein DGI_3356 [Megalodesulfovibrio gigas DSM 1382 = ATCC 19364]